MAHNVESMFSVRQTPWHGLGKIVQEAPTVQEAINMAGLNWLVNENRILLSNQDQNVIDNYKALVRSDNGKVLSVMKESYKVLQNKDAFDFFNPFIDSGLASLETAGSLREGRLIWVLADLNKAPIDIGGGDIVKKYLLLSNSHDGSLAVRVGFTPTRVVCNNTLTAAHDNSGSKLIRVKHSSQMKINLEKLQDIINAYDAKFEATAEQYKFLSKRQVSSEDLKAFVEIVFFEKNDINKQRQQSMLNKQVENITRLFESGAGQDLRSAKGTWWGLYNSVTEYLTHEKGKQQDDRLYSNWFGSNHNKNEKAFEFAMKFAGGQ